ncbi:MAG: amidophosphoribosyltransferase [Patescibacteria group bacterium]|nr:amidophosphoribosyltransferase [Patescibacteria group bacterium]
MKTNYPTHYCGIFGAVQVHDAARCVNNGLSFLQHRGEESCGITSTDGERFYEHKGMGLVSQVFNEETLALLSGTMAIGHNRYSTTGKSELRNTQPLRIDCRLGDIALAHNGNLTNTDRLRRELESGGAIFQTTTDSEVMLHLLARADAPLEQAIKEMMAKVEGAYSLLIMTRDKAFAIRDPYGFRPLSLGSMNGGWVVSSETCAFDIVGARYERDVRPGEIVVMELKGRDSALTAVPEEKALPRKLCSFEPIYFARPDSIIDGRSVYEARFDMGRKLAQEHPRKVDIVIPIPDGGTIAAMGYGSALGLQVHMAFTRNHYIGRSFICPTQVRRERIADHKINLIARLVKGKRVLVIDDSIVRGTTSGKRVAFLRSAGAAEIHMLVSCPPHRNPCHYGIDFPDPAKLAATGRSVDEIASRLGLDSLGYLSEQGLKDVLGPHGHCFACFNGDYPEKPPTAASS